MSWPRSHGHFGGTGSDASDQASPATSFTLAGLNAIDATHAFFASFTFRDATPQTQTVILQNILAIVPLHGLRHQHHH